jgi:putative tributyrin esterase
MDKQELKGKAEERGMQTGTYYSQALGREQPYGYLLPYDLDSGPSDPEMRYPLLVLLHGRDGGYTDWVTFTRIARYLAAHELIVAFPEGDNGWYTNAVDGSARNEDDLIEDFLGQIQQSLPVVQTHQSWGIGGLSMGGYGAVKLAFKYPHIFSLAISFSGALEKPRMPEAHPIFGDPIRDASLRRQEDVVWLAEQALSRSHLLRPRLYFDCGLQDALLEANRRFDGHLTFLGYPHIYRELPGHHTWPYWDRAFRTLLPTFAQELGAMRKDER